MTPWVTRLLVANVAAWLLGESSPQLTSQFAYIPRYALTEPWTIITYMFLHGGFMHLLFNMLGVFFFGPRVEQRLGSTRFIVMYLIAGITGAVAQSIFAPNSAMVGASAGVFGIMMAYAIFWPRDQVMIWGVLPVEIRWLVIITTVVAVASGMTGMGRGVAHYAHLGGYAGAYLYLLFLKQTAGNKRFKARVERPPPAVEKKLAANYKNMNLAGVHESTREDVNRILDKISAEGIGSLTDQEKLFLSNFVPMDDRKPVA
jgi:membrane associated rhomboid family serine protease